jgi:thymidylate synthase
LNLLKRVATSGQLTYGRNGIVKSLFSSHLSFNLQNGFPLLTTKKMFFRGIVEELIFFLKGETDSKLLEAKKINIWKGNTNREFLDTHGKTTYEEGDMGPMYGYQWRNFGKEYKKLDSMVGGVDQLMNVINTIKTDPKSRRILMTDYNPAQADEGVLYPCHSIILQFYVDDQGKFLDMYCFNRSSDLFLGLPFNIASSALLLTIIAYLTNLKPRMLDLSLGDCHIYEEHFKQVEEQLIRIPFQFPLIQVVKPFEKVEELTFEHFEVVAYKSHESIKAVMVS